MDTDIDSSAVAPSVAVPVAAVLAATSLVACGGGDSSATGNAANGGFSATAAAGASTLTEAQAARFLLHAQFSASDAEIASVRNIGITAWLSSQYAGTAGQTGWDWLNSRGYDAINYTTRYYDLEYPGDFMVWNQLMTAPDAMRKRMALALSEYFVVSLTGLNAGWRGHLIAGYWDTLVAHAFGNFRNLLQAVTLSPAMGTYLNTRGNQKENTYIGRQPDENFSREIMQLMTIGLSKLNLDGSKKLDGNGKSIDAYTQDDVANLARVFTGYDVDKSEDVIVIEPVQNRSIGNTSYGRKPMILDATKHSTLEATFLGVTVGANVDGASALKTALDTLFNHPNVGSFFGRQMIQRLVTSNPSPAYVARVATAFNNNGSGVRGDLRAVWTAILTDVEAQSPDGLVSTSFGKLREPMLRLVQWGRTFGINSAYGSWKIMDQSDPSTRLGQSPLRASSVFNFFRPGYTPQGMVAGGAVAPEFQLVNESSVAGYLNMLQGVVRWGIYVMAPEQSPAGGSNSATNGFDITASYTTELAMAHDADALVARLNLLLCAGQLSVATQTLIVNALNAVPLTVNSSDSLKRHRIASLVLLVMASSEYLVQK